MKVAIISAKFPFGPKEPFLEAEIKALSDYIEELTIIPASPPRDAQRVTDLPATVIRMPVFSARTIFRALRMCIEDPKAVGQAFCSIIFPRARPLVRLKNIAVFPKALAVADLVRREGVDHIHSYWLSTPSTVAYVAAQIAKKPWSSTAHRFDIYEDNLPQPKAQSASFIRTISRKGLRDFRKRVVPADWERSIVLHLGAKVPRDGMVHPIDARNRPLTLVCPAALIPKKGHRVLLDALAQVRDAGVFVRCVLAGEGPLRKIIAAEVRRRRLLPTVTLAGTVPHDTLLTQLQSGVYDAVVLPSHEGNRDGERTPFEGIPHALLEGMAAGLPCIATDAGSIPELLDASCGIVVPQSDSVALARAIIALASDRQRGAELGASARQRIQDRYDARQTAAVLSAMLRRPAMLEEPPPELIRLGA